MSARSVVPPAITVLASGASEHDRVITLYDADAWESALRTHKLLSKYPSLPSKLRYGFPLGDFSIPSFIFTPPNHATEPAHLDFICTYVAEQHALGRMSGPYTKVQVESILGSHFVTSPLSVVDKAGSPGKYRLVQNCSYKNADGISVNDQIDPDDFPTKWGTAAEVARYVSPPFVFLYFTTFPRRRRTLCLRAGWRERLRPPVRTGAGTGGSA